jgi:hypothetical protein
MFIPIDGKTKVTWASAIASTSAPTVAELNAGTALELKMTPDGLSIPTATGAANSSVLGKRYGHQRAGQLTVSGIKLKFHHEETETIFSTLVLGTVGFLVVRQGIVATTAWAANQKVEVYPLEVGEYDNDKPAPNGMWDFEIPAFLYDDPVKRATVAA